MKIAYFQPLQPPDSHHLSAAQGWLELGNYLEAGRELARISPPLDQHPDVLEIQYELYAHEKRWQECADTALATMRADPDRQSAWIHYSFALHELKRTKQAYNNLLTVSQKFTDDWHLPYNLACYCAQLGHFAEAQEWFKKAISINDKVCNFGYDDPDLKPMWDFLNG